MMKGFSTKYLRVGYFLILINKKKKYNIFYENKKLDVAHFIGLK